MFGTTHDAILLIVAVLYLVVGLVRANLMARTGTQHHAGTSLTIAALAAIVAVLW